MSIKETLEKIKPFYFLLLFLVLVTILWAFLSLSQLEGGQTPLTIGYGNVRQVAGIAGATLDGTGEVIGSKSGKKYYFPWCGTVKRIKPENQVHFASVEEAKTAGFTAGGGCKGLK